MSLSRALGRRIRSALEIALPGQLLGFVEYYANPRAREPYGGPLNGQAGRRRIAAELFAEFAFDFVWETGTFRGSTTAYFASLTANPIVTVEVDPRNFGFARARLRSLRHVRQCQGESVAVLRREKETFGRDQLGFFYLDAHWQDYLPLADELRVIADYWTDYVILVDDFQVPDDPGYQHDDYGPGKALTQDYLPPEVLARSRVFWPSLPSAQEDGARRGCVLIASRSAADRLARLKSLRQRAPRPASAIGSA